ARGRGRGASNGAGGDGSAGRRSCGIVHVGRRAEVAELPATMREIHSGKGATMFESVEEVQQRFRDARYIASRRVSTVVILAAQPVVLLVDEIDKAEPEFEAFLLEVLSDFQVSVPELGTVRAKHIPLVVLTSNNARELSDGLKRRCLHLFIDFPAPADELQIIRLKVPEVPEQLARAVVSAVQKIRAMDLRKLPSVSESLDWARSLVILNARELDPAIVESTLTMLVKHEKDLERVKGSLDKVLAE